MKKNINVLVLLSVYFIFFSQMFLSVSAITLTSEEFDMFFYKKALGISNYKGNAKIVSIPSTYKTLEIMLIDQKAFSRKRNVEIVEIPDSVTILKDSVFEECYDLKGIIIPDSVTSFGKRMFFKCNNLEEVIIGNGVTSIPIYTFYECSNLKKLTIPNTVTDISESAFSSSSNLVIYGYSNSIAENYAKGKSIKFISIDEYSQETQSTTSLDSSGNTDSVPQETQSTFSDSSGNTDSVPLETQSTSSDSSGISANFSTSSTPSTNGQEVVTNQDSSNSFLAAVSNGSSLSKETIDKKSNWIYILVIVVLSVAVIGFFYKKLRHTAKNK